LYPFSWIAEKCTKTSSPVDRWINPYPLAPLNHFTTPFSFKRNPFPTFIYSALPRDTTSDGKCRARASHNRERFENGETITPRGLPSGSNHELLFELDDVMAGIGTQCKKNLPNGGKRRRDGTSRL
jgi:hypothetical protein